MKRLGNWSFKALAMLILSIVVINTCFKEVIVNAAIYDLSANEINIPVGGAQNLRISGLQTSNSVVWSVANSKIATVSRGTVKGVKIGDTVVTAKIGNVKLKCKVHVKWPDQKNLPYMDNISITLPRDGGTGNGLMSSYGADWLVDKDQFVYMIQNNNPFPVTIKAQMFYTKSNYHDAGYGDIASVTIPANNYEFLIFDNSKKPDEYIGSGKYIISVKKSKTKYIESKINISDEQLEAQDVPTAPVKLTVKNSTGKEVKKFNAYILYFDKYSEYCLGVDKIIGQLKLGMNEFTTDPTKYSGTAEEFKDSYYKVYFNAY